jgi:prepilin-type N-terminal cleavage/methylation domain-containing protein
MGRVGMEIDTLMKRRIRERHAEAGFTMIELLIAMVVLAVGMGGVLMLFLTAIAGNSRSKIDTQAVQLSQTVLEALSVVPGNVATQNITIKDCAGNSRTLSAAAGGAPLNSGGDIDWTQTTTSSIDYVSCGANGTQATYEVRWQISKPYSEVRLINVSARLKNATNSPRLFTIPATLHTMAGQ